MSRIDKEIEKMESLKQTIRKQVKEQKKDEDVSEEQMELYDHVVDCTISVLKEPVVVKGFESIAKKLGEDVSMTLVELFAMAMTNSTYRALFFYDELLQKELDSSFKNIEYHLNMAKAEVDAHGGVLKVFKERLNTIEKKITDYELNKNIKQ